MSTVKKNKKPNKKKYIANRTAHHEVTRKYIGLI